MYPFSNAGKFYVTILIGFFAIFIFLLLLDFFHIGGDEREAFVIIIAGAGGSALYDHFKAIFKINFEDMWAKK